VKKKTAGIYKTFFKDKKKNIKKKNFFFFKFKIKKNRMGGEKKKKKKKKLWLGSVLGWKYGGAKGPICRLGCIFRFYVGYIR